MGAIYHNYYNFSSKKIRPIVSDYIESEFINSVGIGIAIFILTLFLTYFNWKNFRQAVTWTGVGSIDKSFGYYLDFSKDILFQCVYFQY